MRTDSDRAIVDISPDEVAVIPQGSAALKWAHRANQIIFGLGNGVPFALTTIASMLSLIDDLPIALTIGGLAVIPAVAVNGAFAAQATQSLIGFRPAVWLSTALLVVTLGGEAALPMAVAVIQAMNSISKKTGVDCAAVSPVVTNTTFLTSSIISSICVISALKNVFLLIRHKQGDIAATRELQASYLNDKRSVAEYEQFVAVPDDFLKHKYTRSHLIKNVLGLALATGISLGFASEIPKAIAHRNQVESMQMLYFGYKPVDQFMRDFAATTLGSQIISCGIGVPLAYAFMATTLRVLPRDMQFVMQAIQALQVRQAMNVLSYMLIVLATCLTAFFEVLKGTDSMPMALMCLAAAFIANYNAPRAGFFKLIDLLPSANCISVSADITPVTEEHNAKESAEAKLGELKSGDPAPASSSCAGRLMQWMQRPRTDISVEHALARGLTAS